MVVTPLLFRVPVVQENRVLRPADTEPLLNASDRTGEIDQYVLCGGLILCDKSRHRSAVKSLHREYAGSEVHIGNQVFRIPTVRVLESNFTAEFECMFAFIPAEGVHI